MNTQAQETRDAAVAQIEAFEAQWQYDSSYMKHMLAEHPQAFALFQAMIPMAGFRRKAAKELYHVAKLSAFQVVDCGSCLQLAVRTARSDGLSPELIRAVLQEPDQLPEELAQVRRFVWALDEEEPPPAAQREALRERIGEQAMIEISLVVAAAGVFPKIKKVLGYFESAREMPIEI